MFPLYDESTPQTRKPIIVFTLITINVLVFLATVFFSFDFEATLLRWGLVPAIILNGQGFLTFLSCMFLHADLLHLLGNMWFLWLFGDNLEHHLGAPRFLFFYLFCGLAASLVHIFTVPSQDAFLAVIGASGAISGILGGYVVLFPKNKIRAFMVFFFRPCFFSVPAWFYALVWFGYQLLYATSPTSIAYMAHIGGFVAGVLLIVLFKKQIKRKDYC